MKGAPKQAEKVGCGSTITLLRAGHLRGEAREEMIDGLRRGQLGDGRQHAEGIGGQHHDVPGMAGLARGRGIGDEGEGIGGPRVLGQPVVVEIEPAGDRVDRHILQHRAEALGRGVDLRLGLRGQLDGLGVAAALEIEHAVIAPAMLVVADQHAIGRCGERRLAGAGEAEEDRRIAVGADVRGAMHRHHATARAAHNSGR